MKVVWLVAAIMMGYIAQDSLYEGEYAFAVIAFVFCVFDAYYAVKEDK